MAKSFRPIVRIGRELKQIPTYAEVKKRMCEFLKESPDNTVTVYRHRRGEWGEWGEQWGWGGQNKPILLKQGWM